MVDYVNQQGLCMCRLHSPATQLSIYTHTHTVIKHTAVHLLLMHCQLTGESFCSGAVILLFLIFIICWGGGWGGGS